MPAARFCRAASCFFFRSSWRSRRLSSAVLLFDVDVGDGLEVCTSTKGSPQLSSSHPESPHPAEVPDLAAVFFIVNKGTSAQNETPNPNPRYEQETQSNTLCAFLIREVVYFVIPHILTHTDCLTPKGTVNLVSVSRLTTIFLTTKLHITVILRLHSGPPYTLRWLSVCRNQENIWKPTQPTLFVLPYQSHENQDSTKVATLPR